MKYGFEKVLLLLCGIVMSPPAFAHGIGPVPLFVFILLAWYLFSLVVLAKYLIVSKISWLNRGIVCGSVIVGVALSFLVVIGTLELPFYLFPRSMSWDVTRQGLAMIVLGVGPMLGLHLSKKYIASKMNVQCQG